MPVASKIGPASNGPEGVLIPVNNSLRTAISVYFANRKTPVPRFNRCKDVKGEKVENYGYSIRRLANMHEIAYSLLQRAIAAGGETKARSEAHENDMTLTITEEEALEEWCSHMHRWGYPTWLDLL